MALMVRQRKLQVEAKPGGAPGRCRFKPLWAGQSLQVVPPALKGKLQLMSDAVCPKSFPARPPGCTELQQGPLSGPPLTECLGFSLSPLHA